MYLETEASYMQAQVDSRTCSLKHLFANVFSSPCEQSGTSIAEILEYQDSATQYSIGSKQEAPHWETYIGRVGAFAA